MNEHQHTRRLRAAPAGMPGGGWFRRYLTALAGSTPAFTPTAHETGACPSSDSGSRRCAGTTHQPIPPDQPHTPDKDQT